MIFFNPGIVSPSWEILSGNQHTT